MLTNEEITQRIAIISWEDKEPNTANSKRCEGYLLTNEEIT